METGDIVTGGGCLKALRGEDILDTGRQQICCTDGEMARAGGGLVNACGDHPLVFACATVKHHVTADATWIGGLAATSSREPLRCSPESPCTIQPDAPVSVIDVPWMRMADGGALTIDALGDEDAVFVLRFARGFRAKRSATIELVGGAQASNVLIFAAAGNCDLGEKSIGAGTLFCPQGKVRLRLQTAWTGSLLAGRGIDLGNKAIVTHVPFTGLTGN